MPPYCAIVGWAEFQYKEYGTRGWKSLGPTTAGTTISTKYVDVDGERKKLISIQTKALVREELVENLEQNLDKIYSLLIFYPPNFEGKQQIEWVEKAVLGDENINVWSKHEPVTDLITFYTENKEDITELWEELDTEGLLD